ncbi:ethylene-insensitive protein 2-like [Panicum miliaceum]|uniref:Ethylene-insensitive protein 2-like n=1 Tax=Panicum miliaceum TaxID=4540 RepID=A0A3L6QQB8_PANMI|nr:ethylene-insensitive protein 2-like [Panicum miliaceum]
MDVTYVQQGVGSMDARGGVPNLFHALGPALLISMGYIDLGKWVAAVEAGSRFGYDLVLLALIFNFTAIVCQYLAACIGMVTGKNLAEIFGIALGFNLLFEYDDLITGICFAAVVPNLLPYAISHLGNRFKWNTYSFTIIQVQVLCKPTSHSLMLPKPTWDSPGSKGKVCRLDKSKRTGHRCRSIWETGCQEKWKWILSVDYERCIIEIYLSCPKLSQAPVKLQNGRSSTFSLVRITQGGRGDMTKNCRGLSGVDGWHSRATEHAYEAMSAKTGFSADDYYPIAAGRVVDHLTGVASRRETVFRNLDAFFRSSTSSSASSSTQRHDYLQLRAMRNEQIAESKSTEHHGKKQKGISN